MTENLFPLFHAYNRLVQDNKAMPIICTCGTVMVTRLGKDDALALWCPACNTWTTPGIETISMVKRAVR